MTTVRDIMTTDVQTVATESTVSEAARLMRDSGIGDVLVTNGGSIQGILTDRDIAVRVVAEGRDPNSVQVQEICSTDLTTISPNDDLSDAVTLMRQNAIRRLPVVDGSSPVGIISIGDLAIERDGTSALADISAAPATT